MLARSAPQLCEFLVSEYSTGLMTLPSLWQVAMDYLSHCPVRGRHYMQLLLERIALTSDKTANKVIFLCQRYQLKEQSECWRVQAPFCLCVHGNSAVQNVCKVMAMKAYCRKRLGAALTWSIRGKVCQCLYLLLAW